MSAAGVSTLVILLEPAEITELLATDTLFNEALPATLSVPAVETLPLVSVPTTVTAFADLSNVKPAVALAVPLSLKMICALEPGAAMLP